MYNSGLQGGEKKYFIFQNNLSHHDIIRLPQSFRYDHAVRQGDVHQRCFSV